VEETTETVRIVPRTRTEERRSSSFERGRYKKGDDNRAGGECWQVHWGKKGLVKKREPPKEIG